MLRSGFYQPRSQAALANFGARLASIAARHAGRYALQKMRDYVSQSNKRANPFSDSYTPGSKRIAQKMGIVKPEARTLRIGVSSKSAGRLKTKRLSKSKYRKRRQAVVSGVTRVVETGGTSNSGANNEVVYVGHAAPIWQLKYTMWWAVLRKLLVKAGGTVSMFNRTATISAAVSAGPTGLLDGDRFRLIWKANASAAPTTSDVVINNTTGATVELVVTQFVDLITSEDFELIELQFIPANVTESKLHRAIIRLNTLSLSVFMKLDLKIQNRTVNVATDDQADDVNNVPIYGKTYEGYGLGAVYNAVDSTNNIQFCANPTTGAIVNTPTLSELQEPLEYQKFEKVTKIGKIHLDPGQIKTSVLTKKFTASFQYLLHELNPALANGFNGSGQRNNINGRFSSYRMFAVEKMIDSSTTSPETRTAVTIAWEHNMKIMMTVKENNSQPTSQDFVKVRAS